MKKNIFRAFLLVFASTVAILSCKKTESVTTTATACTAGTGGNLTIAAFPKHHGKHIDNLPGHLDTVYVKFNTQEFPGSLGNFDTYFVGEAGEDHVHMMGLKCGNYYFYGAGYDTTIHMRVTGGRPFSTSQTSGEIDLDIDITE